MKISFIAETQAAIKVKLIIAHVLLSKTGIALSSSSSACLSVTGIIALASLSIFHYSPSWMEERGGAMVTAWHEERRRKEGRYSS